jgi:hypothetical protein
MRTISASKAHRAPHSGYTASVRLLNSPLFIICSMTNAKLSWVRENYTLVGIYLIGLGYPVLTWLSSIMIEDLLRAGQMDPTVTTIFFYFDFSDQSNQSPQAMLRSIVCQLADRSLESFNILQALYERKSKRGDNALYITPGEISVKELLQTLREMTPKYRCIYIVLDGLDECCGRSEVLDATQKLIDGTSGVINLLVASRVERDIERQLGRLRFSQICCDEASTCQDIRAYVHEKLEGEDPFMDWPQKTRTEVEESLVRDANGM